MIKQTIKQDMGISGEAVFRNILKDEFRYKNTVTNIGLSEIAFAMLDKNMPLFYIAVGDDDANITTDEIALQSALKGEIERLSPFARSPVSQDTDQNYIANSYVGFGGTPESTILGQTVKEVGLFLNRPVGGVMFARAEANPQANITVQSEYTVSWDVKVNIQDFVTNGGVVYSGSRLVLDALGRYDRLVDHDNLYYEGTLPDAVFTPAPFGLNVVSLGGNGVSGNPEMTELEDLRVDYDTPPTITSLDLTGEASDVNYEAIVKIQKYIPPNTVPFEIKEAGLFNERIRREWDNTGTRELLRTMFSRAVLNVPIPANAEAVLTWEIGFKRGV